MANALKSAEIWRTVGSHALVATHSGNGTATAYLQGNRIVCDFTDLGSNETITLSVPFDMELCDLSLRVTNGQNVGSKTLTLGNAGSAISDAISMATDVDLIRPSTWDSDNVAFSKGDDDIRLTSSAHGDGDARVIIEVIAT